MNNNIHNYIQLGLIFFNGFLISRLFIKCGIAEQIVFFFIKKSKGHIGRIITYIIFTTAVISMFIPNVISVLAVLPILDILRRDFEKIKAGKNDLNTSLAMASLYGANIGGTGSITGSPANMMLIGFLALKNVPGVEKLNFVSWIGWGLPFVLIFSAFAAFITLTFLIPKEIRNHSIDFVHLHKHQNKVAHQKSALILSLSSFGFWILLSGMNMISSDIPLYSTIAAGFFTVFFLLFVFVIPLNDRKMKIKAKMLQIKDCFSNLPGKGFLIVLITVLLSSLLIYLKVDKYLVKLVSGFLPASGSLFLVTFVFVLFTVYLSEFISNTASAVSFFIIALSICTALGLPAMPVLMGISVVSTVPFMTPIASPVNAIAYGGVKGVKLRKMMLAGFFMDMLAVILVTVMASWVFPWYYGVK